MFTLRDVEPADLDAYIRMRCDPVMMAELGGPLPRDGIAEKIARDTAATASNQAWILMIVPDGSHGTDVAGSVIVRASDDDDPAASEIGWMVLPAYQGRGYGKAAARAVLERARNEHRWGPIHAHPAITNKPSNGICRSLGFTLLGETDTVYAGRTLRTNHWKINPHTDLQPAVS